MFINIAAKIFVYELNITSLAAALKARFYGDFVNLNLFQCTILYFDWVK